MLFLGVFFPYRILTIKIRMVSWFSQSDLAVQALAMLLNYSEKLMPLALDEIRL